MEDSLRPDKMRMVDAHWGSRRVSGRHAAVRAGVLLMASEARDDEDQRAADRQRGFH
jgi:hypothetical protein